MPLYVDPVNGGDDASHDGSSLKPFKSIVYAVPKVDLIGGIIEVVGTGVTMTATPAQPVIDWSRQASAASPVTIQTQTPLGVTILGSAPGGPTVYGARVHGGGGLRIQGFRFSVLGINSTGILVDSGSQDVEVDAVEVTGNGSQGMKCQGITAQSANIQVYDSVFHANGADCDPSGTSCSKSSADLWIGETYSTGDLGVHGGVVANNVFYGSVPGEHLVLGPQAKNVFVVNNVFYGNLGQPAKDGGFSNVAGNAVWYDGDNCCADPDAGYETQGTTIENNIFVKNEGAATFGFTEMDLVQNVVQQNLAFQNTNNPAGTDYQPNFGAYKMFAIGAKGNLPNADPLFMAPTATPPDFHLEPGSPAINAGDPALTPPFDATGAPRTRADLGPFQGP